MGSGRLEHINVVGRAQESRQGSTETEDVCPRDNTGRDES
jgi:hypothetical protein